MVSLLFLSLSSASALGVGEFFRTLAMAVVGLPRLTVYRAPWWLLVAAL